MDFFAYLDAGTGSLILQSVVGALLGIGIFLKAFWGRIVGVFKKTDLDSKSTNKTETTKQKTGKTSG